MKTALKSWADYWLPIYSELSRKYEIPFTLQSPLTDVEARIETLILGINPGSADKGVTNYINASEFLAGNECWNLRFDGMDENAKVSSDWEKFFGRAHFFLCGDMLRHNRGIDDDRTTVWANLSPFATRKASHLPPELLLRGVEGTSQLIDILQPRRIVMLSADSVKHLGKAGIKAEFLPLVKDNNSNKTISIGLLKGIPSIVLPHPSQNWGFPKFFIPAVVNLYHAIGGMLYNSGASAENVRAFIIRELGQWQERIKPA